MTNALFAAAISVLEAPDSTPALKTVAAKAILTALGEGLTVPKRATWLVWSWSRTAPAHKNWETTERLGSVPDEAMRADALAILAQDDAGEDVRDLAMAVLSGDAHARHVEDSAILGAVEKVRDGLHAASVVGLIDAVHRARGVAPDLLRAVRDRLASSPCSEVREKAILVAALIADPDLPFIAHLLEDPNAEVRLAVAHRLGRGMPGSDDALDLIERRLEVESHPDARAALLHAEGSLTGEGRPGVRRQRS